MAVRVVNLFGELAMESTLRQVLRAVTYARDTADRMRVIVDSGTLTIYNQNTSTSPNASTTPGPYTSSTWNLIDQREIVRQQSEIAFMQARQRWTIT